MATVTGQNAGEVALGCLDSEPSYGTVNDTAIRSEFVEPWQRKNVVGIKD